VKDLDLAEHKKWRRFVPPWLRALLWADSAKRYDAFLSYCWKADKEAAPVIQSVLQGFLRPWYKVRAKTIFRDLSCLPAGSSIEAELFDRLDRSSHLIVLANPDAPHSRGMELEASYWFSRPRKGAHVLIIVTDGEAHDWEQVRQLVPRSVRDNLLTEPLWVPVQVRRQEILGLPKNKEEVARQLIEDLKQVFLRLYPNKDWGELRGEEHANKRRAIQLLTGTVLLLLALTAAAVGFARYARTQRLVAESRALADQANQTLSSDHAAALNLALKAWQASRTSEAKSAIIRCFAEQSATLAANAPVSNVSFSPDGQRVVTANEDKTASVWNAATRDLLLTIPGHNGAVNSAAFSPDNWRIVTSEDKTARVWNATSGELLAELHDHIIPLQSTFSPDGKMIVTTCKDHTARVWNATNGQAVAALHLPANDVGSNLGLCRAVFSPDSRHIVTACDDDSIPRVWNATSGELLITLKGHTSNVRNAEFSLDGQRIVTASDDGTARVWSATSGELLASLQGDGTIWRAIFSPDGQRVLTASLEHTARVWNPTTGKLLFTTMRIQNGYPTWSGYDPVQHAVFSPDGKFILTAGDGNTARVWNAVNGDLLATLQDDTSDITDAVFSPNGDRILTVDSAGKSQMWSVNSPQLLAVLHVDTAVVETATFSPDGQRIVTASRDGTTRVWSSEKSQILATLKGHADVVASAAFSPDGRRIATASLDRTARVWNASNGRLLTIVQGHGGAVRSAVFSPDGNDIVTASDDGTARVWNAASGQLMTTLQGHGGVVWNAVFSSDGQRIFTTGDDQTARVWNNKTNQLISTLRLPGGDGKVYNAVFSADRERILTLIEGPIANFSAEVLNLANGQQLARIEFPNVPPDPVLALPDRVNSAMFSPDGQSIVSTSDDRMARVWSATTGELLATLEGHTSDVLSAAFSPDGRSIVTASEDGTVRVFRLVTLSDIADLLAR
jgi:WD40 repeat protein